jgi:hypothetical protein
MKKQIGIVCCLALSCVALFDTVSYAGRRGSRGSGTVRVNGYYRKDGTYVRPHIRTAPDGICSNNLSGCPGSGTGSSESFRYTPEGNSGTGSNSRPRATSASPSSYFTFVEKLFLPESRDYLMCTSSEIIDSPTIVYHVYVGESAQLPTNIMCYGYQKITRNQKVFRRISTLKNEGEAKYLANLVKGWYARETLK